MRNQNIRDTDDTNSGGGWMDGSSSHISIVGCIPGPGVTAVITQQQGHTWGRCIANCNEQRTYLHRINLLTSFNKDVIAVMQ